MNNSKEICANIRNAANIDIPQAIAKGLEKACLVIESSAKSKCPVDTGNLRNSITHKVDAGALEGAVGTSTDYAPYIEIGTGIHSSMGTGRQGGWFYKDAKGEGHFTYGSKPHPFLKPAVDNNLSAIQRCFEEII